MGEVADESGWQPLRRTPQRSRQGRDAFFISPFARLARAHLGSVGGDALIALALAGSLFFSIDPEAARVRVASYLLFTMAPFALLSPLIGPAIDRARGGRRMMVLLSLLVRAVVATLMIRHLDSLWLFPEAFAVLVASKAYHVAKSALVPTLVADERGLVEANSKLALLSGIGGAAVFPVGLVFMQLGGADWVMGLATLVFTATLVVAFQIPKTRVAPEPADEAERSELRTGGVLTAAFSMALLRGIVGFLTFLLAFHIRAVDASTIWFGVLLVVSTGGNLSGALIAPLLRRRTREESILVGVLVMSAAVAIVVAIFGGMPAACVLAASIGFAAGSGKVAFDAIVQRDAPDANQGRSFARFETRFQLVWVMGAVIPVVLPFDVVSVRVGYLIIAGTAGFGAFTYLAALRAMARGEQPQTPSVRLPVPEKIRSLPAARSVPEVRRRLRDALSNITSEPGEQRSRSRVDTPDGSAESKRSGRLPPELPGQRQLPGLDGDDSGEADAG